MVHTAVRLQTRWGNHMRITCCLYTVREKNHRSSRLIYTRLQHAALGTLCRRDRCVWRAVCGSSVAGAPRRAGAAAPGPLLVPSPAAAAGAGLPGERPRSLPPALPSSPIRPFVAPSPVSSVTARGGSEPFVQLNYERISQRPQRIANQ